MWQLYGTNFGDFHPFARQGGIKDGGNERSKDIERSQDGRKEETLKRKEVKDVLPRTSCANSFITVTNISNSYEGLGFDNKSVNPNLRIKFESLSNQIKFCFQVFITRT